MKIGEIVENQAGVRNSARSGSLEGIMTLAFDRELEKNYVLFAYDPF